MKRFQYHFEPKNGWMNDPNGLIYYKGYYHAFFQHYPYDVKWGAMHWGHTVSKDLIHWEECPIALFPDMPYENDGGCYSGSAIEKDGKMYLFYTSVSHEWGQTQSMAVSEDGYHFTKYEKNPIINHFPEKDGTSDFRDPKVFRYGAEYRMVIGSAYNKRGRVLQYRSKDLYHWEYIGVLYESKEYNDVIECPDLFCVDDQWVLMYSKIGQVGYQTQFVLGSYNGIAFEPESYSSPEAGPQFYAPQTFAAENGKRVVIGWFYDWIRKADADAEAAGAFAIPRQVSFSNGQLRLYPVQEARSLLRRIDPQTADPGEDQSRIAGIHLYVNRAAVAVGPVPQCREFVFHGTIESVDVLEDEKATEVFINKGEANFSIWRPE